jgi:ribonuclease HI
MARQRTPPPPPELPDLPALLQRLRIVRWDVLIIGDGSGTGWQDGAGWALTLIDRQTRLFKQLKGAMDGASINVVEMMPIIHGLSWFHAQIGRERLKQITPLHVHVISDSEVTVAHGQQTADLTQMLPKHNTLLWAAVREFQRCGYCLHFYWLGRSTTPLNQAADVVASLARRVALSRQPESLTDDKRLRAQRAIAAGVGALNSQTNWSLAIPMLLGTIKDLLDILGPEADRLSRDLERVALIDPATQMPINASELMPGNDHTFQDGRDGSIR